MDLWTYVGALRRWWWLALGMPVLALLLAVLLLPRAPWQTEFSAFIVFPGDAEQSKVARKYDSVILDDLAALMATDAVAERVHAQLPPEMQATLTPDEIGGMLSSRRYSREATLTVSGDSPDEVLAVAEGAKAVLPEAVNTILRPADAPEAEVQPVDVIHEPVRRTQLWLLKLAGVTAAGGAGALCLIALIGHLGLSYDASRKPAAAHQS